METNNKPDIIKFLCGELDYNGVWFGDAIAGKTFWWRSVLRDTIEERDAKIAELTEQNTSLAESYAKLQVRFGESESENQALKSELDKVKKIISDYACYGDSRIMRDQAISFAKRVLKDKR